MNSQALKIKQLFIEQFHLQPLLIKSPGRVNIIGEHTDYNDGFVLPAAIDKVAYLAIALRDDNQVNLIASDLNESFSINLDDLKPVGDVSWPNYLLGSVAQFLKAGTEIKGFNAMLSSEVPMGAGLSSSAAVECATVFGLNQLFQTNFDRIALTKMAQLAEHEYAGVKCGIMDQFASMLGKKDHVIKLDCRSLEFEYIPFILPNIKVVLLNTNVKHSLASSEYNTRRKECSEAVKWINEHNPSIKSLRDADEEMLTNYVLPKSATIYKRANYIVQEKKRLLGACENLLNGDLNLLGQKMFETHEGLSHNYEVSCKELDFLVEQAKASEFVLGARMMGGGFGGCTINLIYESHVDSFIEYVKSKYEAEMNLPLTWYVASTENGTEIIN